MKRLLSMLLVLCMVVTMLPLAVSAEEQVLYSGTLSLASGEKHVIPFQAPSAGTVYIDVSSVSSGVRFQVGNSLYQDTTKAAALEFADIEPVLVDEDERYNNIYVEGYKNWGPAAVTVTFTVTFVPASGDGEVVKEDFMISEESAFTEEGTYQIVMLNETALVTLVNFSPSQTGKYTFTVGANAKIKYCGTVNYAFGYDTLAEDGTQTVTWDCSDVNQSMLLGIWSESDTVDVTLTRTGDVVTEEIEYLVYENQDIAPVEGLPVLGEEEAIADYAERYNAFRQAYTNKWSVPEDAELGEYVDVLDNETHIAVKDQNGVYRLDREDGPVLLIDMDYNGIILTKALTDIYSRGVMYVYIEEGDRTVRYDIGTAVQEYEVSCSAEGYYPLTDDLIFFYQKYADWGVYAPEAYGDGTNEDVWMYCCRALITEDTVLQPENPLEGTMNVNQEGVYWTAPQSGLVSFTVDPADCNVGIYDIATLEPYYIVENGSGEYEVTENVEYVFYPEDTEYDGTALVTYSYKAEEEPEAGTEINPIYPEWIWNAGQTEATATVEVAANTTCYYAAVYSDLELTVDGESYGIVHGDRYTPHVFSITNSGAEAATYALKLATPVGSRDNPAELVIGENTATVEADSQGYFFNWTATADGELSVTMPAGNWVYTLNNVTANRYGDTQWSDSDPVVNPGVITVAKDDVVELMVNTYDPQNVFATPAGQMVITAAFEEAEATGTRENPEVIESLAWTYTDLSQAQGDEDGYFYTYTAPDDGTVTFYFGYNEGLDGYKMDIAVTNKTTSQQMTLLEDGVDNYGLELIVDVKADDVLEINVISLEDAEGNKAPETNLTWVGNFAYVAGTEKNPIIIEWIWINNDTSATASVTVPAGQTLYFNGQDGMILMIDGVEVEQTNGVFSITNSGSADTEYALVLDTPVGAYSNPQVIEDVDGFEDSRHLDADANYYYVWTATEDVKLVLDVNDGANITVDVISNGEDGMGSEQFALAEPETDENWNYVGWIVAENLTLDVKAGQQVKIQVNALMDWDTWSAPAVDYTLTIACVRPDCAVIGDVSYKTVEAALAAAVSGDVVSLINDTKASNIKVIPGVTLDLNGYTLTAEFVAVFNGGNIVDKSAENSGFLAVKADNVIITSGNSQLPVWNNSGYVFSDIDFSRIRVYSYNATSDSFGYIFKPVLQTVAYSLLADGGADNGVTVEVRISWETEKYREYRNLIYSETQIAKIYSLPADTGNLNLTVTGLGAIQGLTEVTVEVVMRSSCGVYGVSAGKTVTINQ